jgi:ribonuclease E
MSSRILIDAAYLSQELRVAATNNGIVTHLDIEAISRQQTKAFIYKGKVTRVEPSLEACFVDYGQERHGFLPLKDISPQYFSKEVGENERPSIKDVIKEGQELVIQVEKIERGNKGAALTTYITLAGSYLVLMPNSPKAGGVSRRIEGDERTELLDILRQLKTPEQMGIIIRTASIGKTLEDLQWDLDILIKLWGSINTVANDNAAPLLIHQESNAMIRALRDYIRQETSEIVINNEDVYNEARKYMGLIRPDFADKVTLYTDDKPLFSHYQIERQIEAIFSHEVRLPSGGSLAIDQTEALIAIDINSSKATKGSDIEETAFATNLEAADEIARQLRLRDIGGLIVIDFIDMMQNQNQRAVEERIRDALKGDRAKVQIGRISRFGLLEMSRQRLRATMAESTRIACPHCEGHGMVRSIPSLALSILRDIEEKAMPSDVSQIRIHLPLEVATYLLNEQREGLGQIEQRCNISLLLIPHDNMNLLEKEIEIIRARGRQAKTPSFKLAVEFKKASDTDVEDFGMSKANDVNHAPAIKSLDIPDKPTAQRKQSTAKKAGLLSKIISALFGGPKKKTKASQQRRRPQQGRGRQQNSRSRNQGGNPQRRSSQTNRRTTTRNTNSNTRKPQHRDTNSSNTSSSSSNRDNNNNSSANRDNSSRDSSSRDNSNRGNNRGSRNSNNRRNSNRTRPNDDRRGNEKNTSTTTSTNAPLGNKAAEAQTKAQVPRQESKPQVAKQATVQASVVEKPKTPAPAVAAPRTQFKPRGGMPAKKQDQANKEG